MRGKHIGSNLEGNSEISGSLSGGIAKTFLYSKEKKPAIDPEIGRINEALIDFPQKVKNGKNWIAKATQRRKK